MLLRIVRNTASLRKPEQVELDGGQHTLESFREHFKENKASPLTLNKLMTDEDLAATLTGLIWLAMIRS